MIRKAVIVVLTLGAVGALSLFPLSCVYEFGYVNTRFGFGVVRGGLVVASGELPEYRGWYAEQALSTDPLLRMPEVFNYGALLGTSIPLWLVFTVLGAYPTVAFIRGPVRRWRRGRKGSCFKCGYNLTGNVTGVCPECGAEIEGQV